VNGLYRVNLFMDQTVSSQLSLLIGLYRDSTQLVYWSDCIESTCLLIKPFLVNLIFDRTVSSQYDYWSDRIESTCLLIGLYRVNLFIDRTVSESTCLLIRLYRVNLFIDRTVSSQLVYWPNCIKSTCLLTELYRVNLFIDRTVPVFRNFYQSPVALPLWRLI
jgi:hypothetical protein